MSEMGDDFRRDREQRQQMRRSWIACDICGKKSPVGEPCFNCDRDGWIAWNENRKSQP